MLGARAALRPQVLASAAAPLEGEGGGAAGAWWLGGEKPWQLLATAKELAAALGSGAPEEYVSHLPVHQVGWGRGGQMSGAADASSCGLDH